MNVNMSCLCGCQNPQPPQESSGTAEVRFLHAAAGYGPFQISIDGLPIVRGLPFGRMSSYQTEAAGRHTLTVSGRNSGQYGPDSLTSHLFLRPNDKLTLAVTSTPEGLMLVPIPDASCEPGPMACFRVSNLAYGTRPMNVLPVGGVAVFQNVAFPQTTAPVSIGRGSYDFIATDSQMIPMPRFPVEGDTAAFRLDVRPLSLYTVYLLRDENGSLSVRVMEERT